MKKIAQKEEEKKERDLNKRIYNRKYLMTVLIDIFYFFISKVKKKWLKDIQKTYKN